MPRVPDRSAINAPRRNRSFTNVDSRATPAPTVTMTRATGFTPRSRVRCLPHRLGPERPAVDEPEPPRRPGVCPGVDSRATPAPTVTMTRATRLALRSRARCLPHRLGPERFGSR
ncbi:hypothetical protein YM304_28790 [Ilumatobacter coccineus YM16-304]|uniref:Uncharacterized protein n=1 Tax=Ilumatobacter coccineus (strain NBRC 103263 / KCTC 29153 / YM16-304) TaxID=1313172 RepID=A0A6C7EA33_ILUCY|nr:hypothetical protein YM304_28790 [Ilumatobacter coccineus YM16-304]